MGLVRQRVFGHYFGIGAVSDAFTAAFRIPNFLQNLFGEGGLSASFIPVYAGLLEQGDEEGARRLAGAIAALLGAVVSAFVLVGVLTTPWLIGVLAPEFRGEQRELAIELVRIFFPGAGLLVLSAWCLGILNSHRRFFLSYAAPVVWNLAIIAALVSGGSRLGLPALAVLTAWGAVIGSALQLGVQLPTVRVVAGQVRLRVLRNDPHVRSVVTNFLPALAARGVVQISAFIDLFIALFLPAGAATAIGTAQVLYNLPVSLFGMSVSAAELPEMARGAADPDGAKHSIRVRLEAGLRRIALGVVPSAVAFVVLGNVLAAALFQTGRFSAADATFVWGIIAGSAVGLLASTMGRLFSSAHYALGDTRSPLLFATVRVVLTGVLGWWAAMYLPALLGLEPRWGAAGLTASAGVAGWIEYALLRRSVSRRVGRCVLSARFVATLWLAAALAALAAFGVERLIGDGAPPLVSAAFVLGTYGAGYALLVLLFGVPEARGMARALLERFRPAT